MPLTACVRTRQYALYLLCRSLAFGYFAGIKRGLVPYWEHGDVLLMAVANLQILYSYMLAPDTLNVRLPCALPLPVSCATLAPEMP